MLCAASMGGGVKKTSKQDFGLQCQTPLKDLNVTYTVVTWPLSSVYVQTRLEFKEFSLERLYPSSLVEVSKSLSLMKNYMLKEVLSQKEILIETNCGPKQFWVKKNLGPKKRILQSISLPPTMSRIF